MSCKGILCICIYKMKCLSVISLINIYYHITMHSLTLLTLFSFEAETMRAILFNTHSRSSEENIILSSDLVAIKSLIKCYLMHC